MQINEMVYKVHQTAVEKGWWDNERNPLEIYALVHSEISEAVEEARKGNPSIYFNMNDPYPSKKNVYSPYNTIKPEGELIELADAIIRIADYCGKMVGIWKRLYKGKCFTTRVDSIGTVGKNIKGGYMKQVMEVFDQKKQKKIKAGIYDTKTCTYIRKVNPEKHFMRKFDAYGVQEEVIQALKDLGCTSIIIQTPTESLLADMSSWLAADIKVMDYGNGKQRFMPVSRMAILGGGK